jgi:hypothetical protein
MKRPQIPAALSFDGCGINNASAEYCPRILTIPQAMRDDQQIKALGQATAALPALLEALEGLLSRVSSLDQSATHDGLQNCDAIANARSALIAAGYQF